MSYFFNFKSNGKFKPKGHIFFFFFTLNPMVNSNLKIIFFLTLNPMINSNLKVIFFNFKPNGKFKPKCHIH